MFAFLAAVVFFVELVFKPTTNVDLTALGLLLLALHLAAGTIRIWPGNRG